MLVRQNDLKLVLLELSDLEHGEIPEQAVGHEKELLQIVDWARTYLSRPHPDIGRKGHVCPFVKTSMNKGLFYLAVHPGDPSGPEEVAEVLRGYRDWFIDLVADGDWAAQYTTILVLFPDLPRSKVGAIIDGTQDRLKVDYVTEGLMIGEFHDGPPAKGGLWNPDFRPLSSPVPLLAMRHMVPTDFPFLQDDPDYVAEYLKRFGEDIPPQVAEQVTAAATRFGLTAALATAQKERVQ